MENEEKRCGEPDSKGSEQPRLASLSAEVALNRAAIEERMDVCAEEFDDPRSAFLVMEEYARQRAGESGALSNVPHPLDPNPAHEAQGETAMITSSQSDAPAINAVQRAGEAASFETPDVEAGRLEIELSGHAVDFLNGLMRDTGDSPGELLRKALGLYRLAVDAWREGKAVGAAAEAGSLETEFVGS